MSGRRQPLWTLGLDPGVTTGWAVLDEQGSIVKTGEYADEDILDGLDCLVRWVNRQSKDLEVCIENLAKGTDGELALRLRYVIQAIENVLELYDVSRTYVNPGTWKNHRVITMPLPVEIKSRHTRDAVQIARWRMANRSPDYHPRPRLRNLEPLRV